MEKLNLKRATCPEDVGLSSSKLLDFFAELQANNINYHSFVIIKGDTIAFESYTYPYSAYTPHAMYSATKSVTSTAIGFAISEGLLTLDTPIIDIFPEYAPKKPDARLARLTVRHLLTMSSGKEPSMLTDKSKSDWVQDFFKAAWRFEPGSTFKYVNENIYMLCAILVKLTGISVTEYLTPRLFQPLGIAVPFWETDPKGVEAGGWGLYLTPEDFAKFTLCYKDGGKFAGKQVVPEWWAIEATKKQIDNAHILGYDSSYGYGYCFWRNSVADTFRVDGMFSQFGIALPKYDACLVMTAGQPDGLGIVRGCIWRHFPAALEGGESTKEQISALEQYRNPPPRLLPYSERPAIEERINGKIIKLKESKLLTLAGMPLSMIPLPVLFMAKDRSGNINNIKLDFTKETLTFSWTEAGKSYSVKCGMDGRNRAQKVYIASQEFTLLGSASWQGDTLEVWIRPLESVALRIIKLAFKGNKVRFTATSSPSMVELMDDIAVGSLPDVFPNKVMVRFMQFFLKKFGKFLEPKLKGKVL